MTRRHKLIKRFTDRRPRRISFYKKDGSLRFMSFVYQGGAIVGSSMTVWDLEAEGIREINLTTVQPSGVVLQERKRTDPATQARRVPVANPALP